MATFGFDHIWPGASCDVVAASLDPFELQQLRARNRREELAAFDGICRLIGQKYALRSQTIKWLQVIVNKADLFWGELDKVAEYYSLGGSSDFAHLASDLVRRVGSQNLEVWVLPGAQDPGGYNFDSARGSMNAASTLGVAQCAASVSLIKYQLEELCERAR